MGWAPGWGRRCDGVRRPGQDSGAQQRTGIDTVIAGGRTELIKDAALLQFGAALIPRAESRGQVVNAPSLHASGLPFEKNRFEATIHSSRRILLRQFAALRGTSVVLTIRGVIPCYRSNCLPGRVVRAASA